MNANVQTLKAVLDGTDARLSELCDRAFSPGDGITKQEAEELADAGILSRDVTGQPWGFNHRKEAMLDMLTRAALVEQLGPRGKITIIEIDDIGPRCRIEIPGQPDLVCRVKYPMKMMRVGDCLEQ